MNTAIHEAGNASINRFFALDARVYEDGALPAKTNELLGLVASMVLRRDDGITYHVALVVGGSIVIPDLRRAAARLGELPAK